MSTPYIGEIRMFAGNFAPSGWAFCHGQLLSVSENDALFSLIGTIYGGDGRTTFGLPDLRGRIPVHMGGGAGLSNRVIGGKGGEEQVTVNVAQIPSHSHPVVATVNDGTNTEPDNHLPAGSGSVDMYAPVAPSDSFNNQAVASRGGSQPHENLMPYVCINFIISLFGIYPSRT